MEFVCVEIIEKSGCDKFVYSIDVFVRYRDGTLFDIPWGGNPYYVYGSLQQRFVIEDLSYRTFHEYSNPYTHREGRFKELVSDASDRRW